MMDHLRAERLRGGSELETRGRRREKYRLHLTLIVRLQQINGAFRRLESPHDFDGGAIIIHGLV
jgi:hypothetical protein